ncbi:MAG: hypothetical protein HY390_00035 [Deltaproteobacteria bacterium]|nr:hypothetical protein [Deltaproteobacteria bacterium]
MKQKQLTFAGVKKPLLTSLLGAVFLLPQVICAEEMSPIDISSQTMEVEIEAQLPKTVAPAPLEESSKFNVRVTPQFGFLGSMDGNQLLLNKFTTGLSAELMLSSNVSIEGNFRYGRFNIRPDFGTSSVASDVQYRSFMGTSLQGGPAWTRTSRHMDVIGDMRQIMLGANLKYDLFPHAILSPFVGGGISYFDNEYYSNGYMKIGLPQHVYGASLLGGMKLKLSRAVALVGRMEAGTLLNNKSGTIYWGPAGAGATVVPRTSFRSYDHFYTALAGISFGL